MRRLALALLVASCGDGGSSGPDAPPGALTLSGGGKSFSVTGFQWGANNDCPASGSSVISVTIQGSATVGGIGLCLPRPDLVGGAPLDLGDDTKVQLVGANAQAEGCALTKLPGAKPTGTATFTGFSTAAGAVYQVTVAGQVAGHLACAAGDAGTAQDLTIQLAGTALVTPR